MSSALSSVTSVSTVAADSDSADSALADNSFQNSFAFSSPFSSFSPSVFAFFASSFSVSSTSAVASAARLPLALSFSRKRRRARSYFVPPSFALAAAAALDRDQARRVVPSAPLVRDHSHFSNHQALYAPVSLSRFPCVVYRSTRAPFASRAVDDFASAPPSSRAFGRWHPRVRSRCEQTFRPPGDSVDRPRTGILRARGGASCRASSTSRWRPRESPTSESAVRNRSRRRNT